MNAQADARWNIDAIPFKPHAAMLIDCAACKPEIGTGRHHVEKTCASGTAIIPGTRFTACQISRKYAPDVIARAQKYKKYM